MRSRTMIIPAIAVSIAVLGLAFIRPAHADVSPAGCLANDFTTQLNKSVAVAYDETNPNGATTITYSVYAGNPQNVSNNGCDVDGVAVTLTTPDGVVHTLQTAGSYPVGTALVQVGSTVSYVANSADIVGGDLTASATATGVLHDKVSGTDPFTSGKTLSLSVIHPNTTVTITPSVATTSAGSSITLTVTEQNTGDDALSNPSVILTPPGTTLNASSTSFTGGDTGGDGILGVGETWTWTVTGVVVNTDTTYAVVGNATDGLGNPVTSPNYPNEQASTTVHVLNNPTIATTLSSTSVAVGASVHDSSALTGATAGAGGSVTYKAYAGANSCTGTALFTDTQTVTSGVVPNSGDTSFANAGTYSWQAVYSGDANNNPATSTCSSEQLTVSPNTPTIATTLSANSVTVGTAVHDSSTLTGATADAGGTVQYAAYTDSACTAGAQSAGTKAVTAGVIPDSNALTFNTAGSYYWQAVYSGDAKNSAATSSCQEELLTVGKSAPTIVTNLSASSSVSVNTAVHDSATLTGETADAGGTATYTVYTDNECTLGAISAGVKTVVNGNVPNSDNINFNTPGTYYWQVAYSGDANNAAATSTCGSEVVTVGKLTPSITTTLSATSVSTSTPVHDSATLNGASADAGGTATYSVFTDSSCTAGMTSAGVKTVVNRTVPDSDALTFATPGTYYWQVAYSGDANNAAATSSCAREVLTVTAPPPPTSCEADWKFVGGGWVNYGPVVYLNQGGRMFDPSNSCRLTLPLQYSPTNPTTPGSSTRASVLTNPNATVSSSDNTADVRGTSRSR